MTRSVVSDYDAQGHRSRITHPDGAYFEYRYDPAGRLTQLTENGPSTPLALLTYDAQGRRDAIGRDTAGAATGFGYDAVSRLGAIVHNLDGGGTSNDLTTTFAYNPASQIVTRTQSNNAYEFPISGTNRAYVTNGRNQYTQITGDAPATLTWDDNGNLTSDGSTSFGYDTENRLTSASGAKSATLTYDPLGRLHQVTSAGVTTRFLYDGDRLIAEYNTAGTVQRRYVHGAAVDEPLVWYEGAAVSSASRRYLHADHQGSVIATSNAAGARLDTGTYDAYGVTTAPSTWRFQYTGQAAIPPLGLYYYKARFYNPTLGRFMQTDPIGYDDDVNLYTYVGSDPLNKTDPTGMYESHWLLRTLVPGQVTFDSAMTAAENGNYGQAGALMGAMVGEQVLTVATLGTASAGTQTTRAVVSSGGRNLSLKYKPGWSGSQRAAADRKVGQLDAAAKRGELRASTPERSGTSARSRFEADGSQVSKGQDVDHVQDLQLGGKDVTGNMQALDSSVNRSLGSQVNQQIKDLPKGTRICGVRICD